MPNQDKNMCAIFRILRDFYAVSPKKLDPTLSINRDVSIDGDDASELIRFLEKEIDEEITIEFSRYFYGEGLVHFGSRENLTVADLCQIMTNN